MDASVDVSSLISKNNPNTLMSNLYPHQQLIEFKSRSEVEAMQLHKLKAMLKHVALTNKFYADKWREAGVDVESIGSFADFRAAIPMVEKQDFVNDQQTNPPYGTRISNLKDVGGRTEVYTTSGTSGQGVELHVQSKRELKVMEEIYGYYFSWAGLKPGDITMLTLPITMLAGGRAEYQGGVAYDLSVFPIGNYNADQKIDLIRRFNPKALFGSSSYFAHLATLMGESARTAGVEVLLTGLEGVGHSFYKRLEDQWGAKCAERFGCAQMRTDFMFTDENGVGELGDPGLLYNMEPYVYLEILDTTTGLPVKDGEFGEMVVTSLYHFDNPVIRNRLKDGAIFRTGRSAGSPKNFNGIEISSIARIDDVKKIKGINVYPQAVDDLVFSISEIEQYEVVLTYTNDFTDLATLNVQIKHSAAALNKEELVSRIKKKVKERLGINFDIKLVQSISVSEYKARRWKDLRERN